MGRSAWKGPFVQMLRSAQKDSAVDTSARSATIIPSFVGRKINVHNGRKFVGLFVTEEMVGHKLGEFAPTRFVPPKGAKLREKKK